MTVEQKQEQLAMRTAREEKGKPASKEARKQEIERKQEALKQAARADAARSKKRQPVRRRGEDDEDDEEDEEDGDGRAGRQAIPGQAGERAIERKRAHDAAKEARKEAMFAAGIEQAAPPTGGGKADDNPLCPSWATSGECSRNPQFMWAVCAASCSGLSYAAPLPL